jgi:hypothetical protein
MSSSSKNRISQTEKLYATDKSVSVQVGGAKVENTDLSIDLDKTTELTYKSQSSSGYVIAFSKGRGWIATNWGTTRIELKFLTVELDANEVALVEQNNLSSTVYMISWTADIETKIGTTTLTEGSRIMIAGSDLSNPAWNLSSLIGTIDDTLASQILFVRNNGWTLLKNTSWSLSSSGSDIMTSSGTDFSTPWKYIEITDPLDGSMIRESTFAVMGNILSTDVKKVTINDVAATISPVNKTFVLQGIPVTWEVINIVYKAYADNDRMVDRWVISVFATKTAVTSSTNTLIPDNFPISNKDFPITFPTENPYKTTESLVRVEGSVPANRVWYVMVNDYRLQKFLSWGTKWYYFANTATETMKEGINLYNIRFYSKDNNLLYTQVFTIVKESKNATVSGESIQ